MLVLCETFVAYVGTDSVDSIAVERAFAFALSVVVFAIDISLITLFAIAIVLVIEFGLFALY